MRYYQCKCGCWVNLTLNQNAKSCLGCGSPIERTRAMDRVACVFTHVCVAIVFSIAGYSVGLQQCSQQLEEDKKRLIKADITLRDAMRVLSHASAQRIKDQEQLRMYRDFVKELEEVDKKSKGAQRKHD